MMIFELVSNYLYGVFEDDELPWRLKNNKVYTIEEFYNEYIKDTIKHEISLLGFDNLRADITMTITGKLEMEDFKKVIEGVDLSTYFVIRHIVEDNPTVEYRIVMRNGKEQMKKYDEIVKIVRKIEGLNN